MSTDYAYRCVDKSILLNFFKKYYFSLFLKLVPKKLTANYITLIGSLSMWIMLILEMVDFGLSVASLSGYFIFLLHLYMVGDHLDGMQAKKTKTSSPLGEFLDHYFDIYNSGITVLGFFVLLKVDLPYIYFITIISLYGAFAVTMIEEKVRGEIYFAPFGSLESLIITIAVYFSLLTLKGQSFWVSPSESIIWGYSNYWLLAIFVNLGCFGTMIDIIIRIKKFPKELLHYFLLNFILLYFCTQNAFDPTWGWFLLASFNGSYIGKVMESHLCNLELRAPNWLFTLVILFMGVNTIYPFIDVELFIYKIVICLFWLKTIVNFCSTVFKLKEHWLWVNP